MNIVEQDNYNLLVKLVNQPDECVSCELTFEDYGRVVYHLLKDKEVKQC